MTEILNKNKNLLYWLIIALISSLIVLSWINIDKESSVDTNRSISVTGESEIEVKPDTATINISIEEKSKDQQESNLKMTQKTNTILEALNSFNIKPEDIKTKNVSLSKEYDYSKQPYIVTGHVARLDLTVKVRDIKNLENIKTQIAKTGANMYGVDWSIEDIESYKREASTKAILNAKDKAKRLSKDLNVNLININSFSEYFETSQDQNTPIVKTRLSLDSSAQSTQNTMLEGVNKVKATVDIGYNIE